MESSSKNKRKQKAVDAASGSKAIATCSARPHWRRRDPADTAVYVVQPDQFCAVVQQLTGAASSSPPPALQQHGAAAGAGGTSTTTNAAPSQLGGGTGSGKTLGQIQQECMAWANSDDV